MKSQAFTVYDSKAEAYLRPFFEQSIGTACRAFQNACNNEESAFAKNPEDFTLFHLGSWDDETATFELLTAKRAYGLALEYIRGPSEHALAEMLATTPTNEDPSNA